MPLKYYLIFMSIATLLCWTGWGIVVSNINPTEAGGVGFVIFYLSGFLALVGTFSLLGFFLRVWFSHEQVIFRHLGISFRQAVLFALLLIVALILQGERYLTWWNMLMLVAFLTVVEFVFISKTIHSRE